MPSNRLPRSKVILFISALRAASAAETPANKKFTSFCLFSLPRFVCTCNGGVSHDHDKSVQERQQSVRSHFKGTAY